MRMGGWPSLQLDTGLLRGMVVCVGSPGLEAQIKVELGRGAQDFWLLLYSVPILGFSILVGLFLHFFPDSRLGFSLPTPYPH